MSTVTVDPLVDPVGVVVGLGLVGAL